ncbi:M28 family peptidase [Candidatus Neomarinimicrobiota bacterium]
MMRRILLATILGLILVTDSLLKAQPIPYFSGQKAFELLLQQVEFGPRYPGSAGHNKMTVFLDDFLRSRADELIVHATQVIEPQTGRPIPATNYLARFNAKTQERVMLMAHYDTRQIADEDPDPAKRSEPILGANDGASGVAILLQIATILVAQKPEVGVDLLFVDAEDMGHPGIPDSYGLGSQAFVKEIDAVMEGRLPRYVVLLDMVGDSLLTLPLEQYSWNYARDVTLTIWNIGEELGYTQFVRKLGGAVFDDHVPFLRAGIPAVDLIDMDYPSTTENYWHTTLDTPDKCSAESLEAVGTVITTLIFREQP